jgi:hypothetical protein
MDYIQTWKIHLFGKSSKRKSNDLSNTYYLQSQDPQLPFARAPVPIDIATSPGQRCSRAS